jgi:hypothetical protein
VVRRPGCCVPAREALQAEIAAAVRGLDDRVQVEIAALQSMDERALA